MHVSPQVGPRAVWEGGPAVARRSTVESVQDGAIRARVRSMCGRRRRRDGGGGDETISSKVLYSSSKTKKHQTPESRRKEEEEEGVEVEVQGRNPLRLGEPSPGAHH